MELELERPLLKQGASNPGGPWLAALTASLLFGLWTWVGLARGRGLPPALQLAIFVAGFLLLFAVSVGLRRLEQRGPALTNESGRRFGISGLLLLVVFLPEYLGLKPPPIGKTLFLGCSAIALFIAFSLVALRGVRSKQGQTRVAPLILAVFCVAYFVATSLGAVSKLHSFGYVGQDIAYFTQCLYTTLHGKLLNSNMYHDLLYNRTVSSDFAAHNQLVLFLFLPVYLLHKTASTLLVFRDLLVVLCAWPVYLIARRTLSRGLSALAAVAFLLVPAVFYQNLYDFAPLSSAGLPLLFAMYYFLEGRFRPFFIMSLLTLAVREDLVFAVFSLGLLALWERREWKWTVVPAGLAIAWAVLSWKIIFPYFLAGSSSAVDSCFAYLGPTPGEMARRLLSHPGQLFSHHNIVYLKQMVDSLGGGLFLGSPAWLGSLPYLGINVLAEGGGCNTAMVYRHYSMVPAVLLFASFLISLEKVSSRVRARGRDPQPLQWAIMMFVLAAALNSAVFVTGKEQLQGHSKQPWHTEATKIIEMVPAEASVAVPRYLLPAMANRDELYQSLRLLEYHHPTPEFIVIDKDWDRLGATEQWRHNYDQLQTVLRTSPQYTTFYGSDNFLVYRRCAGCAGQLPHVAAQVGHE